MSRGLEPPDNFCMRKDTLSDVLNLSVFRLHRFRPHIMFLVLIFRLCLLRNAVEFVLVFLSVLLFLLFLIHAITSWIVCAGSANVCMRKAPRRVLFQFYSLSCTFISSSITLKILFNTIKRFKSITNVK